VTEKDREELRQRERELRKCVDDIDTMIAAMKSASDRLHLDLDGLNLSTDEIKGQLRIVKERQVWLIREIDKLRTRIAKQTWPGDSK
jgi:chromosome segregation ATPase